MKSASCNTLLGLKDEARWRDDMADSAESTKGALVGRYNARKTISVVRPTVMAEFEYLYTITIRAPYVNQQPCQMTQGLAP